MYVFKKIIVVFFCLFLVAFGGCGYLLRPSLNTELKSVSPGSYLIDKAHTTVLFKVNHMGFSTFVGRFNEFDASLEFDAEHIERSQLNAIVQMASIDVNNPSFEESLKGRFWFNVERYPQAVFTTRSASVVPGGHLVFLGDLEFLGKVLPLEIKVVFNGAGTNLVTQKYTLGFDALGVLKRSDYGLDQYVPAIGDDIRLEIFAEFQRK